MKASDLARLVMRTAVIPSNTIMDRLTQLVRSSEHKSFRSPVFDRFCIVDAFGLNVLLGGSGLITATSPVSECEQVCVGFCRRVDHAPLSTRHLRNLQSYCHLLIPGVQLIGDDMVSKSPVPAFLTIPATQHNPTLNVDAQRQAYTLMMFLLTCDIKDLVTRPPTAITIPKIETIDA